MLVVSVALGTVFVLLALLRARDIAFVGPVAAAFIVVTMVAHAPPRDYVRVDTLDRSGDSPGWIDRAAQGETVSVLWYEQPG